MWGRDGQFTTTDFLTNGRAAAGLIFSRAVKPTATMSGGLFALMSKKGREDKRMKELKSAFDSADKDGDGKLDMNEWFEVLKEIGTEVSR